MVLVTPIGMMVGYPPLSNITPFTYRDNATYLEQLEDLRSKLNTIVGEFNGLIDGVNAIVQDQAAIRVEMAQTIQRVNDALTEQDADVDKRLLALHDELVELIGVAMSGVCDDPTNGKTAQPVSQVISRVYDYARVFGWFAKRFDDLGQTAATIDGHGHTARHHDLSPSDVLDDDLTIAPRKLEIDTTI